VTEKLAVMKVEREPSEEASDVEDPVALPLEHLKPPLMYPLAAGLNRALGPRLRVVALETVPSGPAEGCMPPRPSARR
jgi:hypothetical protein